MNLSPITLLHYNHQQINKFQHNLFQSDKPDTSSNYFSNISSKTSIPPNSGPTLDILPFLSNINDHIHQIDCTNSLKDSFKYAVDHCLDPKIYNVLMEENANSSLFHLLPSRNFPLFLILALVLLLVVIKMISSLN